MRKALTEGGPYSALEQARMTVHDRAELSVLLNRMRGKDIRDE